MTTLLHFTVSIAVGILVVGAVVFGGALLLGTAPVSLPIAGIVLASIYVKGTGK